MAETSRQSVRRSERGFSVLELVIVIAIMLILAAMITPNMLRATDADKVRGGAQSYAYLLQLARTRAEADNQAYEVLTSTSTGATVVYIDLNDDGSYEPNANPPEPANELPKNMTVTDTGAPFTGKGFDTTANLGIVPIDATLTPSNSQMVNYVGTATPGLAFNERGLPCQRLAAGAACTNATTLNGGPTLTAWITYLKYQNYDGTTSWAAVTVTPAGRIKTWIYQNGSWQ